VALKTIETERLTLRAVEPDLDLDAFAPFMADPEVVRFIGGTTLTRDETADRLAAYRARFEQDGFGIFALVRRDDGVIVGRCGLLVWQLPEWTITTEAEASGAAELELGWALGRPYWSNGYATEAAAAVRDWTFGELGRKRLISLIAEENAASAAVAGRLGMTVEGTVPLHGLIVAVWSLAAPRG
jgi:RimJ/RimL family protein N-acetyltransferase